MRRRAEDEYEEEGEEQDEVEEDKDDDDDDDDDDHDHEEGEEEGEEEDDEEGEEEEKEEGDEKDKEGMNEDMIQLLVAKVLHALGCSASLSAEEVLDSALTLLKAVVRLAGSKVAQLCCMRIAITNVKPNRAPRKTEKGSGLNYYHKEKNHLK